MKTSAIRHGLLAFDPADPTLGGAALPAWPEARQAARQRAGQLFLAGHGLPARWQGRARWVMLELGPQLGDNFLATWAAWRADPAADGRLVYLALMDQPPDAADLRRAHAGSPWPELAEALCQQWPAATHDLHTLDFDGGRVQLLLAFGPGARWLPELLAQVDAFSLNTGPGAAPAEPWDLRHWRACARLATPEASLVADTAEPALEQALSSAGFITPADTREPCGPWLRLSRRRPVHADRPPPPAPPGRRAAPAARHALVIGAGLAGAAAARALLAQGLRVTVLERRAQPAAETSGNLAGLFHGVVHRHDGAHAQLLRAASWRAAQLYRPLVAQGLVPGQVAGLLRCLNEAEDLSSLQALLAQQGLPAAWAEPVSAVQAGELAGLPVARSAWWLPAAGWVSPAGLVRHWLSAPGLQLRCGQTVQRLVPQASGEGWRALDEQQQPMADADVVVLANAHDAQRLAAEWTDAVPWPLGRSRGQVSLLPQAWCQAAGWPAAQRPLASGGYLISLPDSLGGGLLCGATQQPGDEEAGLRPEDHRHNLSQVQQLTGLSMDRTDAELASLAGRVGWRLAADDRLPLLGPLPSREHDGARRLEQPAHVPRVAGLYVLTALGSRGLTVAPLLGEALAAWITGAPMPLATSLLDAVDVARFVSRRARHGR